MAAAWHGFSIDWDKFKELVKEPSPRGRFARVLGVDLAVCFGGQGFWSLEKMLIDADYFYKLRQI